MSGRSGRPPGGFLRDSWLPGLRPGGSLAGRAYGVLVFENSTVQGSSGSGSRAVDGWPLVGFVRHWVRCFGSRPGDRNLVMRPAWPVLGRRWTRGL